MGKTLFEKSETPKIVTPSSPSYGDESKELPSDYYNFPNLFDSEGVDHFNISVYSPQVAGRIFAPEYHRSISYPGLGRFFSVYSLWVWLCWADQNDDVRKLDSKKLKLFLTQLKNDKKKTKFVSNFKCIIGHATWIKVSSDRKFREEIKKLPDHIKPLYYTTTTQALRIARPRSEWFVPMVTEMINAIKEDRNPFFDPWATHPELLGNNYLEGFFKEKIKTNSRKTP